MAYLVATPRPGFLRRIGTTLLDLATAIVTARPTLAEVERLTRTPDAVLHARGTTRQAEIARLFGPRALY